MSPLSLSSLHKHELEKRGFYPSSAEDGFADLGADGFAISNTEISARVLYIADRNCWKRVAWLRQVISTLDHGVLKEDVELCLAQAEGIFDCLILHASSIRRLKRPVRRIHSLMPGKLILCLLDQVSSKDVAELLGVGADDVFSLDMCPIEAKARLRAAYRRQGGLAYDPAVASTAEAPVIDQRLINWVEGDVPLKALGRRERILFKSLLANAERLMRYEELERLLAAPAGSKSARERADIGKVLKVSVSRLRAVLPDYMHISNSSGLGYSLRFK